MTGNASGLAISCRKIEGARGPFCRQASGAGIGCRGGRFLGSRLFGGGFFGCGGFLVSGFWSGRFWGRSSLGLGGRLAGDRLFLGNAAFGLQAAFLQQFFFTLLHGLGGVPHAGFDTLAVRLDLPGIFAVQCFFDFVPRTGNGIFQFGFQAGTQFFFLDRKSVV